MLSSNHLINRNINLNKLFIWIIRLSTIFKANQLLYYAITTFQLVRYHFFIYAIRFYLSLVDGSKHQSDEILPLLFLC